jgi:hypothetical protein
VADLDDFHDIFGCFGVGDGGWETVCVQARPLGITVSMEVVVVGGDDVFA